MATQPDMSMFGNTGPDMSMFSATPQRPKPVSRIENIGRGLKGAYGQAVMSGSFVQPVRWVMEATNFGGYNEKLRQKFPGQTEEWYKKKRDELYDEAILIGRDNARAQVENNPYPGQTVGNFVAAVPGSVGFTDVLLPGSSIAKGAFKGTARQVAGNVAKHVGKQAAVQGTLGGIEDTIAQGFDIAEGLQDGIDTQRLGQNAAFSAALGGGFGGVQAGVHAPAFQRAVEQSNAPDFVKGLFLERGRDLIPETPEFKSQVGQVSPAMLPENITKHRQVLATGTKDDIDAFYNSVGGPRPSPESIDNWLVERQGFSTPVAPKADVIERQIHRDNIKAHVENATKTWKNKPQVNLYDSLDEMSPEVKEAAIKDGVTTENTVGFYSPVDGQVHLFANQIKTPEAANAVLFHESLGHYGLAQQYGVSLDKELNTLITKNIGQFGRDVDKWIKTHPGQYGGSRIRAAEEVLAKMSEKGPLPKSIGDTVIAGVNRFARNMGIDLKYGDAEVRHILSMAHNAVINGKGRDVIANRFGGLNAGEDNTSRRMYIGPNARTTMEWEGQPFTGPDGMERREISDQYADWDDHHSYSNPKGVDLDEVLIHPQLFKAYPELRNVKVVRDTSDAGPSNLIQGYLDPHENKLHINPNAWNPASTALHEIQHWIQYKEGFALGGNQDMFRLDNKANLNTLKRHYETELEHIRSTGLPRGRTLGSAIGDPAEGVLNKIKRVDELLESADDLKFLYKYLDDIHRKVTNNEDQAEVLRDMMEKVSAEKAIEIGQRVVELNRNSTDLIQKARKAADGLTRLKGKFSDLTYDMYNILTGEIEARETQLRRNMSIGEREQQAPFTQEGFNPDEMIMYGKGDGPSFSQDKMTPEQFGAEDKPLPFTSRDVVISARRRGELERTDQFGQAMKGEERAQAEDRLAREYGDALEEMENVRQSWKQNRAPLLPTEISVYDNRTGQPIAKFESRTKAFEFIDQQGDDAQFLGIDRVGTTNRFMTPEDLRESLNDGTVDINKLEQVYEDAWSDYVPQHRSDAEVRRAATDLGMTPAKVKKVKDIEDLSARVYRMSKAAEVLTDKIKALREKQNTPNWTLRDQDNLRQAVVDQVYIMNRLWDDKGEIARALRVSKMGYTKSTMQSYQELLAEHGGSLAGLADDETLNRFVRSFTDMMDAGNPAGANSLIRGLTKPNWEEYLLSGRSNMMLSGLSTHVTAIRDMIDGIGLNLADHTLALIPSLGREGLRAIGVNVKQGIHPAEVGARYWAILRSAMDAATYVNAAKTLKEGSAAHTTGGRQYARIPLLSKVGDLIAAEDQFFRAFATNMHLYGLGTRRAIDEARTAGKRLSFHDLITQGADYAKYPSSPMLKQAQKDAETDLLLAPNIVTSGIDAMRHQRKLPKGATPMDRAANVSQRIMSFIANFLFPFVRTATNSIYERVIRRSPLTIIDPKTYGELMSGGVRSDVAVGRIMYGTAMAVIAWEAAGKGLISGEGPENPSKKQVKMATGWRPGAVNNETNYGINPGLGSSLIPGDLNNQTVKIIAGAREAWDNGANKGQVLTSVKLGLYSLFKGLADNVWLGDLGEVFNTATESGSRGEAMRDIWLAQQATSVIPNLAGQVARVNDQGNPLTYNKGDLLQTTIDTAKSKIPGLRETLPDRRTPFGEPVQGGATFAGQATILPQGNRVTGGQFIEKNTDPVVQEVARLDEMFEQSILTPVQRNIKIGDEKIELNNREFSEYQREAGQRITETIREAMDSEEWEQWDDEQKAGWIKKMQKKVKQQVREEMFGGDEDDEE